MHKTTKTIYLDHAAGAPIAPTVLWAMAETSETYGNPSAYNNAGRKASFMLSQARTRVARFLNTHTHEIIFTASGSEANTLAIIGAVNAIKKKGVITATGIEHLSVLMPMKHLKNDGYNIVTLPVSANGILSCETIREFLKPSVLFVSVMYANNEVGAIQPIMQTGKIIKEFRKKYNSRFPIFHVDACQAAGYLNMDVQRLGCDLLSFNGSKISGPRGIGVLYVRSGIKIEPLILGGAQEYGLRAGTENLPAIVGLSSALDIISKKEGLRVAKLRDELMREIKRILPDAKLNGPINDDRLPNNVHISVPGVTSETLLLELDNIGISAGSGSACTAREVKPSHVLQAMGVVEPYLSGAIRFSLGRTTTRNDIRCLVETLPVAVQRVRRRYRTR